MRLWERGIPLDLQKHFLQEFDPKSSIQDQSIMSAVKDHLDLIRLEEDGDSKIQDMWNTVTAEVQAYFSLDRLRAIGGKLDRVIAGMPKEQPITIIPSDRHMAKLLGMAEA